MLCQSVDWFLYDKDFLHERVKQYAHVRGAYLEAC